jgi:sec-independent protein translocase protein TatA
MSSITLPVYYLFLPNLGMGELSVIFLIILLLFGPGKLPGVMKAVGDGFRQFREATNPKEMESPEKKPD